MNKLAEFWQAHLDEDNQIAWPEPQAERDALARTFFGLGFVEALDSWLERADDLLDNAIPDDESLNRGDTKRAVEDKKYRDCFAALTPDQKTVLRRLVRHSVHGAMFSVLVHIDQIPRGEFEICLIDKRPDSSEVRARVYPLNENRTLDLHDEFYDWIWEFSRYAKELMTKVPSHGGFIVQYTV